MSALNFPLLYIFLQIHDHLPNFNFSNYDPMLGMSYFSSVFQYRLKIRYILAAHEAQSSHAVRLSQVFTYPSSFIHTLCT